MAMRGSQCTNTASVYMSVAATEHIAPLFSTPVFIADTLLGAEWRTAQEEEGFLQTYRQLMPCGRFKDPISHIT